MCFDSSSVSINLADWRSGRDKCRGLVPVPNSFITTFGDLMTIKSAHKFAMLILIGMEMGREILLGPSVNTYNMKIHIIHSMHTCIYNTHTRTYIYICLLYIFKHSDFHLRNNLSTQLIFFINKLGCRGSTRCVRCNDPMPWLGCEVTRLISFVNQRWTLVDGCFAPLTSINNDA